jgi:hypothetical protein
MLAIFESKAEKFQKVGALAGVKTGKNMTASPWCVAGEETIRMK